MEILRLASKGLPRQASRILFTAMRLAVLKGLNHLPDELLQQPVLANSKRDARLSQEPLPGLAAFHPGR